MFIFLIICILLKGKKGISFRKVNITHHLLLKQTEEHDTPAEIIRVYDDDGLVYLLFLTRHPQKINTA